MPVTAKLSRRFYEQLGDEIANELVDWFNAVDETYRKQLSDLNDLNWKRFEAGMDARFAEFELKMDQRFRAVDERFGALEQRVTGVEQRLARLEVVLERRLTEQTRWMLAMWLGTVLPLGGLMVGLFTFAS